MCVLLCLKKPNKTNMLLYLSLTIKQVLLESKLNTVCSG